MMSASKNIENELRAWERTHLSHEGTSSPRRMAFTAMMHRVVAEATELESDFNDAMADINRPDPIYGFARG